MDYSIQENARNLLLSNSLNVPGKRIFDDLESRWVMTGVWPPKEPFELPYQRYYFGRLDQSDDLVPTVIHAKNVSTAWVMIHQMEQVAAVEAKVAADLEDMKGKTFFVTKISGYVDSDSVDIALSSPAKITISDDSSSLKNWNDHWCDPYWSVSLCEPHQDLVDVRSLWIHGHSYHRNGLQSEAADIVVSE